MQGLKSCLVELVIRLLALKAGVAPDGTHTLTFQMCPDAYECQECCHTPKMKILTPCIFALNFCFLTDARATNLSKHLGFLEHIFSKIALCNGIDRGKRFMEK